MKTWLKRCFLIGVVLYLIIYFYLFLTGSLFYFGEAVSYEGLMRLLRGLPFATSPDDLPISLTPYSPLFLLPLVTIEKLFSITSIDKAMLIARLHQTFLLVILFVSLNKMRKCFFPLVSSTTSFLMACGVVFFYSPAMELALRPDTFSFLCECWAVFCILSFLRSDQARFLWLSALLFSLALAFKLNTAGGLLGVLGFFFVSKDWKSLFKLGAATAALIFLFLGAHQLFLGTVFSQNILVSIQSQPWHYAAAIEVYLKLLKLFLLPLSVFYFLVFWGVRCFEDRAQTSLFTWVLGTSFVLAFLGQMKWGAFHNYFLGTLYLGLVPASCAIYRLSKISHRTTYLFLGSVMVLFMIRELSIPSKIWLDKRYFFELARLQELIQEKAPSGFIYSNDEKIKVAFAGQTAIGVLTEELLWTTPKFKALIPKLQEKVKALGGFQAYITPCSFSPPLDWGVSDLNRWEKIQTGNYCLYTHAKK